MSTFTPNIASNENEYTLDLIDYDQIPFDKYKDSDKLTNIYWFPNPKIIRLLSKLLNRLNITSNVIDVGCGKTPFPNATHVLDFTLENNSNLNQIKLDLDYEQFPHIDNYFNFVYCRHTLEDIQNPHNAFNEFTRISKCGYIETPSPLIEMMRGAEVGSEYRGYIHHRYFVWSNLETNTLYFLPKLPIVEHLNVIPELTKKLLYICNNYPVYWNNYYLWNPDKPPKIHIYRHGINFEIREDYGKIILDAIYESIKYTNHFVQYLSTN